MIQLWRTISDTICRRRVLVWVIVAAITIVAALGIPRIEFDTQQDTLVSSDSQLFKDNVQFQSQFGGGQLAVIFDGDPHTLLQGENLKRLQHLHDEISNDRGFLAVVSPFTLLRAAETAIPQQVDQGVAQAQAIQTKAADNARAQALAQGKSTADADAAATAAGNAALQEFITANAAQAKQFSEIGELKATNPKFMDFVLFTPDGALRPEVKGLVPDPSHALLIATIRGNMSVNEQDDAASRLQGYVRSADFQGITSTVAGENLLLKDLSDSLRESIPLLGIISTVLMAAVVLTVFRARWRLLHLPIVGIALVIAFGIVGFAGFPLTMASTAGLPILVGLSVDFGIQFHNRYEEELEHARNAGDAMRRSLSHIGPALLTALLAAWLGFAALHYSLVPMIRDFSAVLSIGIGAVFIVVLLVLNSILFQRDHKLPPASISRREDSFIERGLHRVNHATIDRPIPILALALIVAFGGMLVDHRIPTETEPEDFIPSDSQTLKDLTRLQELTATANTIDFLVTAPNVTDPAVVTWMNDVANTAQSRDSRITGAQSLASLMTTGSNGPVDFSPAAIDSALQSAPPEILKTLVAPDHRAADLSINISNSVKLIDQQSIIDEVQQNASPPPGVTIKAAGLGVIGVAAETRLTSHRMEMTLLALTGVFLLLLAVTRNLVYTVFVVLPVGLAMGWTSAAMYLFRVPLNPLTAIAGPLVVALGTEFAILLMLRYREERQRGAHAHDAMEAAYVLCGRAIAASAFTVIGAFLALAFHPFPLLSQFGIVAVLGVALALAGAMLVMPPLLVWADSTFSLGEEVTEAQ